jgi:hypothetical protein
MLMCVFVNSLPGVGVLFVGRKHKKQYDSELHSGACASDKKMKKLRREWMILLALGVGMLIYGNWTGIFMSVSY